MAYTRAWTDVAPADSDQASTLGLAIRNLRSDIEERMNTLTNNTWDSDPAGGPLTMKLNIPASMCQMDASGDWAPVWITGPKQAMQCLVNNTYLYVPVVLPQGVTLTGIRMAGRMSGGLATVLVDSILVGSQIATMDSVTSIGSSSSPSSTNTWTMMSCGALSQVMGDGDVVTVVIKGHFVGSPNFVYYGGLEVTYTRPAPWNCY